MGEKDSPPRVFISYSHDSDDHKNWVLALAEELRDGGVDCHLDLYEESPPEGWPSWMLNQVEEANYVLVVCTETYHSRFRGKSRVGSGKGVKWEGAIISQTLYEIDTKNAQFIPILRRPEDSEHIPIVLRSASRYDCSTINGYNELYRRITGQHATPKRELGPIRRLPVHERLDLFPNGGPVRRTGASVPEVPRSGDAGRPHDFAGVWPSVPEPDRYFENREDEFEQIASFLAREDLRLLAIVGRRGIGKTTLLGKVVKELKDRHGSLPDTFKDVRTNGGIYLEVRKDETHLALQKLFERLCSLLDERTANCLRTLFQAEQVSTEKKMQALLDALPRGCWFAALDGCEMPAGEPGETTQDDGLAAALCALLKHDASPLKVMLVCEQPPAKLFELGLDSLIELVPVEPLTERAAVDYLRHVDPEDKLGLKSASHDLLKQTWKATSGFPWALRKIVTYLKLYPAKSLAVV